MAQNRRDFEFNKRVRDIVSRDSNKLRLEYDKFERQYNSRLAEIHSMQEKMKHSMRELALEKMHIQEQQLTLYGGNLEERRLSGLRRHRSESSVLLEGDRRSSISEELIAKLRKNENTNESSSSSDSPKSNKGKLALPHRVPKSIKTPFPPSRRLGLSSSPQRRGSLPFHRSAGPGTISPASSPNSLSPAGSPRSLSPVRKISDSVAIPPSQARRRRTEPGWVRSPGSSPMDQSPHSQQVRQETLMPPSPKESQTPFVHSVKVKENVNKAASFFPQSTERSRLSVDNLPTGLRNPTTSSLCRDAATEPNRPELMGHGTKDPLSSGYERFTNGINRRLSEVKHQNGIAMDEMKKLRSNSLCQLPRISSSELRRSSDATSSAKAQEKQHAVLSRKRSSSLPSEKLDPADDPPVESPF